MLSAAVQKVRIVFWTLLSSVRFIFCQLFLSSTNPHAINWVCLFVHLNLVPLTWHLSMLQRGIILCLIQSDLFPHLGYKVVVKAHSHDPIFGSENWKQAFIRSDFKVPFLR